MRQHGSLAALVLPISRAAALPARAASDWSGVDEKVVEKFAREAGRPPRQPLPDTDRGDLRLLVFPVAGAVGGLVSGYSCRSLFPPRGPGKG